ncbi:DMT family transporter [Paenibacillus chitinolyticus]|uniref:DMT family transporter n=1 Tax=Paenibacillus chitinolyticus TaxID=79263 RepID=UPI0036492A1C
MTWTSARSYLLLIFCVFVWALNYMVRQVLLREFPPMFLSALSLTIVSGTFLLWAWGTRAFVKITGKDALWLCCSAGIGLIANQILLFRGLQLTTATNASLIFTLSPLFTAGLAALFLKERVTWRMVAGSVIAISGLAFALNVRGLQFNAGDWIMAGATFTFSCNLIFVRILTRRLSPFIVTVYSFALSAVLFDPFVLAAGEATWIHPAGMWALVIVTVIVAQGLTGVMWNKGMQTLGAAKAAIVLNLQPLMTMLLEFLLFGRAVTAPQLFGAALVFTGVLLGTVQLRIFSMKKKRTLPEILPDSAGK